MDEVPQDEHSAPPQELQMDAVEMVSKFSAFIEQYYLAELLENVRKGDRFIVIDFSDLVGFDPVLADMLLDDPENVLKAAEMACVHINDKASGVVARIKNLPPVCDLYIRNIRSKHLQKFYLVEGVVRQKSDVRPQVTSAKFECPSCGAVISVIQVENKFKEPSKCRCGRKGKFRILNKELVDAQLIKLEEVPDQVDGGAQPKRLDVFLTKDLVSPLTESRTNPGAQIKVTGVIKEVPITLRTGAQATRFDLLMEANHVEPIEQDLSDIRISDEEEIKIKELSRDSNALKIICDSLAPGTYGHDKIKQALILQQLGGVQKKKKTGVTIRGDIHVMLIGDPGGGKCVSGDTKIVLANGQQEKICTIIDPLLPNYGTKDMRSRGLRVMSYDSYSKSTTRKVIAVSKRHVKRIVHIKTRSGSSIETTPSHPFFVIDNGFVVGKRAQDLQIGEYVAVPRLIDCAGKTQTLPASVARVSARNGTHIRIPLHCTEDFARFLGYLIGDGYCAYSSTSGWVALTGNDHELLNDFSAIAKNVFSVKTTKRVAHAGKTAHEVYCKSRELVRYLEQISPELLSGSAKKTVPQCIQKSPRPIVAAFLRALFDCDGTASKEKREISLTSASKELVEQIRLLLRRFGISSQTMSKMKRATNSTMLAKEYYHITISGEDALMFGQCIGFSLERKQHRIFACSGKMNTNKNIIPVANMLGTLRSKLQLSQFEMGVARATFQHYERGDRQPSYARLQQIINTSRAALESQTLVYADVCEEVERLQQLVSGHLGWDNIVDIQVIEKGTTVYDVEVEGTHNFITNGFVVHNSQLLKRMSVVAPKSRFVSGRGASGTGLTATVVKDEFLQGWSLEAGALVLAHRGLACIDELDKMTKEDTWSMHEAMEQQSVSISKANIQASLRCETTILAAANPKFGRFDPFETVGSQINLPSTLINRFDLIFPVRDVPDQEKDSKLASFILEQHQILDDNTVLDTTFLRKYIAYARQHCKPVLSNEAIEELRVFFVQMRSSNSQVGKIKSIPISARQLEGLVRLSEAHAKLRLSSTVESIDSKKAIELLDYCLRQVAMDEETGMIDIDRIATDMPASQRSKIITLKEIIVALESRVGKVIPLEDIMTAGQEKGMDESDIEEVLQKLKRSGDLFEPKRGFISRI